MYNSTQCLITLGRARWRRLLGFQTSQAIALEGSIARIPLELWHLIATSLSLSSQASLALSCHTLAAALGTSSWAQLRNHADELLSFLLILDAQLPDHLLCFRCRIYHTRRFLRGDNRCGHHAGGLTPLAGCFSYPRFSDVQLAMRAVRLGPRYGQPLPSLNAFSGRGSRSVASGYTYKLQTLAINGGLVMRLETSRRFKSAPNLEDGFDAARHMGIRYHYDDEIRNLIRAGIAKVSKPAGSYSVTSCCTICPSEYELQICSTHCMNCADTFALKLIRWTDLGDGLDACSPRWQSLSRIIPCWVDRRQVSTSDSTFARYRFEWYCPACGVSEHPSNGKQIEGWSLSEARNWRDSIQSWLGRDI